MKEYDNALSMNKSLFSSTVNYVTRGICHMSCKQIQTDKKKGKVLSRTGHEGPEEE
jgi:hypothetical protein